MVRPLILQSLRWQWRRDVLLQFLQALLGNRTRLAGALGELRDHVGLGLRQLDDPVLVDLDGEVVLAQADGVSIDPVLDVQAARLLAGRGLVEAGRAAPRARR